MNMILHDRSWSEGYTSIFSLQIFKRPQPVYTVGSILQCGSKTALIYLGRKRNTSSEGDC